VAEGSQTFFRSLVGRPY